MCYPSRNKNSTTQLRVALSPDPVVPGKTNTFTVSGIFTVDLLPTDNFTVFFSYPIIGFIEQACTDNCPKAGEHYTHTANVPIPSPLTISYSIEVSIENTQTVYGCAF